jgi:hypothetical protein
VGGFVAARPTLPETDRLSIKSWVDGHDCKVFFSHATKGQPIVAGSSICAEWTVSSAKSLKRTGLENRKCRNDNHRVTREALGGVDLGSHAELRGNVAPDIAVFRTAAFPAVTIQDVAALSDLCVVQALLETSENSPRCSAAPSRAWEFATGSRLVSGGEAATRATVAERMSRTARKQMIWIARLLRTFGKRMAVLSPNCQQVSRLQSENLDHKLPILQRAGLRIHLVLCKWCRRYGKQIRFLRNAAREHPDDLVEPSRRKLPDTARERIKQTLRAEEE